MKILVTGGAGFIGSHVVAQYIQAGHEVVIIDNLSTGHKSNISPNATFYQLDIRDPVLEEVFDRERPQIVNHHAAQADLRLAVSDPDFDASVNIQGPIHLAQLSVKYGVNKIIYISSGGAVYGEPVTLPCTEEHPIQPLSPYGVSKYTFELYLYTYKANFGLDYTILRYANVYGPRQDPHGEAGVVAIFMGRMLEGKPLTINGSGDQERDFVYVGDCARANLLALEAGSGGIYNLGNGQGTSINQVFEHLQDITAYALSPIYGPPKVGETFRIFLDCQRAGRDLGWKPEVDLKQGLQNTVNYFRTRE